MNNFDQSQRFIFDQLPIRGQIVHLNQSYQDVLSKQEYPAPIAKLIGEFMAAAVLISNTLKFEGSIILQAKGEGQVRVLMAECKNQKIVRSICRYNEPFNTEMPLFENGQLALTIEPLKGKPYQGLIELNESNFAQGIENYFLKSEQIRSRIILKSDGTTCAGMFVQSMPESAETSSLQTENEDWNRILLLTNTLSDEELLSLANAEILHRLYHEEVVRTFEPIDIKFQCGCSKERCAVAIKSLGKAEAQEIIQLERKIGVDCQFCNQHYSFNGDDIEQLFSESH